MFSFSILFPDKLSQLCAGLNIWLGLFDVCMYVVTDQSMVLPE